MTNFLRRLALVSILLSAVISPAEEQNQAQKELPVCTVSMDLFGVSVLRIDDQLKEQFDSYDQAVDAAIKMVQEGKCQAPQKM